MPGPDPLLAGGPLGPGAGAPPDALILGGGAAGLWAAGTAAERGARVLLLEKNPRVGVKILASGGGACNLTTTLGPEEAARLFGPAGARFLRTAFRLLPPAALRAAFDALGVPTDTEPALEKVWPVSRRARDVAEALLRRAQQAGARVHTSTPVTGLTRTAAGFCARTPQGTVEAPRVLVCTGGCSYPRTGTTGDAYAWLAALGHTLAPPVPALVPLVLARGWVRELAGIALEAHVRAVGPDGRVLGERRRPLLFTHLGLSGPAAMDVSRWFARTSDGPRPRLVLDLLPEQSEPDVRAHLESVVAHAPEAPVWRTLPEALPERLRRALAAEAGQAPSGRAGSLSRAARHALVQAAKHLVLEVAGTRGFDAAEVTAGGVVLAEVDPRTMASRVVPGLYLAGEVLDLDGPIGGFNFQSAFATGEVAGRALAAHAALPRAPTPR